MCVRMYACTCVCMHSSGVVCTSVLVRINVLYNSRSVTLFITSSAITSNHVDKEPPTQHTATLYIARTCAAATHGLNETLATPHRGHKSASYLSDICIDIGYQSRSSVHCMPPSPCVWTTRLAHASSPPAPALSPPKAAVQCAVFTQKCVAVV